MKLIGRITTQRFYSVIVLEVCPFKAIHYHHELSRIVLAIWIVDGVVSNLSRHDA